MPLYWNPENQGKENRNYLGKPSVWKAITNNSGINGKA